MLFAFALLVWFSSVVQANVIVNPKNSDSNLEIKGAPHTHTAHPQAPVKTSQKQIQIIRDVFFNDLSLIIPLDDVVILVLLVNLFALFNKARMILVVSYIFCLKWVFWSNYTELLKQSDPITRSSTYVLVVCGVLTLILFCLDRFNWKR